MDACGISVESIWCAHTQSNNEIGPKTTSTSNHPHFHFGTKFSYVSMIVVEKETSSSLPYSG